MDVLFWKIKLLEFVYKENHCTSDMLPSCKMLGTSTVDLLLKPAIYRLYHVNKSENMKARTYPGERQGLPDYKKMFFIFLHF